MGEKKESQILPLAVGAIKDNEENSTIYVNCNSAVAEAMKEIVSGLEELKGEILFPAAAAGSFDSEKVPIIGGSVVKIQMKSPAKANTSGVQDNAPAPRLLNKYKTGRLKAYVKAGFIPGIDPKSEFPRVADLVNARLKINKCLNAMPNISENWHVKGVASLVLSRMFSDSISDAESLQKKIDPLISDNIRLTGLKTIGSFKFVPMQVLKRMLDILVNDGDDLYGLKNYVGISGITFEGLAKYLEAESEGVYAGATDEAITQILLDLFPIFHVEEDFIEGEGMSAGLGYYTVHDDSLYIKMPDLSGRDSSGYSSNIYSLGEEADEHLTFCFELLLDTKYTAIAFDHQAPPAVELLDGHTTYPESTDIAEITISKEGLYDKDADQDAVDYQFFLSPIITPKKKARVRGFVETQDAVEMFTAPVLTKGYMCISDSCKTGFEPVVNVDLNDSSKEAFIEAYTKLLDYIQPDSIGAFDKAAMEESYSSAVGYLDKKYLYIKGAEGSNYFSFADLGLPMSVPLTKIGADRLTDVLGEMNRPEVLLGFRDGAPSEEDSDEKFFEFKTASARDIVVSNRPNILTDIEAQIPTIWIPLEKKDSKDDPDNEWVLEIPYSGTHMVGSGSPGLNMYSDGEKLEFALYVVDNLGQFVRVPGKNIEVFPKSIILSSITPNGFYGHRVVMSPVDSFFGSSALVFEGDGLIDVVSINFYTDEAGKDLVGSIQDGDTVSDKVVRFANQSATKLKLYMEGLISAILGSNVGTYYVRLQLANGETSPPRAIYIASDGTAKTDLPIVDEDKATFEDPFGLSAPKFGKSINSVPILMDGQNAEIKIKYNRKIFGTGLTIYAYIAISASEKVKECNCKILNEDVGWVGEDIVRVTFPVESGEEEEFYVPTTLEYKYGGEDFERINYKKVKIKFPGTNNVMANLSRFPEFEGPNDGYAAYILLTNEQITSKKTFVKGNGDYAILPMGEFGNKPDSEVKPFITAPHVFGFALELPAEGGKPRVESNISHKFLFKDENKKLRRKIKGINLKKLTPTGADQNFQLISSDGLDRLAIIFSGPKQAKMKRMYKAYIGTTKLKKFRAGRVKYGGNNLLVANFKNIKDISDEGWVDVTISKKDKYFNVTYDSTLYNRTTVTLHGSDISEVYESVTKESGDKDVLATGKNRLISIVKSDKFVDSNGEENLSSIIFPGGNTGISPLPLIPEASYKSSDEATDTGAVYDFANPIKIYPTVDLVFGAEIDGQVSGICLSDAQVDDKGQPQPEIIGIDTNGQTTIQLSIADMADRLKEIKKQMTDAVDAVKAQMEEAKATFGELSEEYQALSDTLSGVEAEAAAAVADAEESEEAVALTAEEAEAEALALARSESDASGGALDDIAEGAQAAADVAEQAAEKFNEGLAKAGEILEVLNALAATISDDLSPDLSAFGDSVEAALAAMGPRPSDFTKVNIKYVYIDKSAAIITNFIREDTLDITDDEKEFRMVLGFRFAQVAAIKFNSPEIIEARIGKPTEPPYMRYGKNPFSKMIVNSGDDIFLKTIGATQDTKISISGKREKTKKGEPFTDGIYMNFIVTIPDMSGFNIFATSDCLSISMSNTNENRMRLKRQMGNDIALNLDDKWSGQIFGGKRNKQGSVKKFQGEIEMFFLKFTSVMLDKSEGAKESLQSFCDFSHKLTAELSLHLRNFKVLLIPIKVIFCIIDVICALMHPIRLVFAIIRLFLCLYDLILLIPQLSVPAMFLALLLHLLELLLCVILKILGIINAINEIITALADAIEEKNYPAMVALEEAINEHLFSLEADLSVLEPIITILALFLELLQLMFAFPCQIGADDDDEACIDPSQLAGLILGKVAPKGRIEPDALLPLAQTYTTIPLENIGVKGNTPPTNADPAGLLEDPLTLGNFECNTTDGFGDECRDDVDAFLIRPSEMTGSVIAMTHEGGTTLTGLTDSTTGENKLTQDGGFFYDANEDGDQIINVDYRHLRFNGPDINGDTMTAGEDIVATDEVTVNSIDDFQATFGLSFTKSVKKFAILTGPDPRIVEFQFKGKGETNALAFGWWFLALFFRKKSIDMMQCLDTPPSFLKNVSGDIQIADDGRDITDGEVDFISPIDGYTGSTFLEYSGTDEVSGETFHTLTPKPLTVTIDLQEPGIDPVTLSPIFTPVEVTKTFGNIPMVALVDDEFNVYFIQEQGIRLYKEDGVWKIHSISAKMINHPSAPKKKFSREDREVYEWSLDKYLGKADGGPTLSSSEIDAAGEGDNLDGYYQEHVATKMGDDDGIDNCETSTSDCEAAGSIIVKEQANHEALIGFFTEVTSTTLVEVNTADGDGIFADLKGPDEFIVTGEPGETVTTDSSGTTLPESVTIPGYEADGKETNYTPIAWSAIKSCIEGGDDIIDIIWFNKGTTKIIGIEIDKKLECKGTIGAADPDVEGSIGIDSIPFPGYRAYDWSNGNRKDQKALLNSLDAIKVFDFPTLYIVDVRQCADDIAAACGASGPMELLLDLPGFEDDPSAPIKEVQDCLGEFLKHFNSEELDLDHKPVGLMPRMHYELAQGMIENETTGKFELAIRQSSIPDIITKYDDLKICIEDAVGTTCRFVLNPLNTTFRLLEDDDNTPLTEYINPEREDLKTLMKFDIVDEDDFSDEMTGFPKITGAMEYASGIGDLVVAEEESKVLVEIIPRDCYDAELPQTLDLSDKIKIDFVTDETGSAELVEVVDGTEEFVDKDESTYTLAVFAGKPGKVVIKATVCSTVIQAVTEAGIIDTRDLGAAGSAATSDVDCIEDSSDLSSSEEDGSLFAPGELMKVDRTLTILFVPKGSLTGSGGASGRYGDDDREESAKSAKPGPQTFGTKLEN